MVGTQQEGEMRPELKDPQRKDPLLRDLQLQELRRSLVQRVAASRNFKSSPRLRDFLLYVADCAIRNAPEEATEQQIGMKVFGRPPGYNSSEDSIVRSHARLLRQKLADYFEKEGVNEPLRIDVPKGHYLVVFGDRDAGGGELASVMDVFPPVISPSLAGETLTRGEPIPLVPSTGTASAPRRGYRWLLWLGLGWFVLGGLCAAGIYMALGPRPNSSVARLWQPFLKGDPPLLIYSNGVFIGNSTTGMRYATREELQNPPANAHLIDHYTGIGEITGLFEITQLFYAAHASFILKRSHLVTWDEARQRNLIFIGSPAENLAVRALPSDTEFTLVSNPAEAGYRVNHPRPGEPPAYMRPEQPLTSDYAVVSLLPSVQPGKNMMLLSGATTLGTEAAVDFATRPEGAAELLKSAIGKDGQVHPFEALLETTIIGGVPLQTRLITIRVH